MLDAGLKATVNSDDPSYFGGYLLDNFVAVAEALELGREDLVTLVRNSIEGSFSGRAGEGGAPGPDRACLRRGRVTGRTST